MSAIRTAMWAKKGSFKSAIHQLEVGHGDEEMGPGERKISGFKMTTRKK